jgi:hypothetical protein
MGNIAMNYGVTVNSPISRMSPMMISLFKISNRIRIIVVLRASCFEILNRNSDSDSTPSN